MAKAKVLLVEDNKTQAELVRQFLDKRGYDVIWAENGMAALKAAKTEQIDLILLDVVLPDIDGNEVCRWLKLNDDTRAVPVIMLTEKKDTLDKVTGLESGANDYLPKPFDESELNARIYVQLRAKLQHDDLKKKNRQLEDMLTRVESLATLDSLTGLSNRRRFETLLENEFRRSIRYQHSLSCMLIDIDHFKQVNDLFGHQVGDSLLKEIAQVIQSSIREVDTAARWGGEEFVVLSPNTPTKNAKIAAARILKAISSREFTGLGHQRITVSIGIAGLPDPVIDTQEKLVHTADLAMYEAKKKGRNRIEPE
jgi:two-component system cell cycle response regulator